MFLKKIITICLTVSALTSVAVKDYGNMISKTKEFRKANGNIVELYVDKSHGSSCYAEYFFVENTLRSESFGTCMDNITTKQEGDMIMVTMPKSRNNGEKVTYIYANGQVTDLSQPEHHVNVVKNMHEYDQVLNHATLYHDLGLVKVPGEAVTTLYSAMLNEDHSSCKVYGLVINDDYAIGDILKITNDCNFYKFIYKKRGIAIERQDVMELFGL